MGNNTSAPAPPAEPLYDSLIKNDLSSFLLTSKPSTFFEKDVRTTNEVSQLVEQRAELERKVSDFAALLQAGVREDATKHPEKSTTIVRQLEALASTLAPVGDSTNQLRFLSPILATADRISREEREQVNVPFFRAPVVLPKASARSNMLKQLVLETLSSFVAAIVECPDILEDGATEAAVDEINKILAPLKPAALFEDISAAYVPAEKAVESADARRCVATSSGSTRPGAPLENGKLFAVEPYFSGSMPSAAAGWQTDSSSKGVWGIAFPQPVEVSSLMLFWLNNGPGQYAVEVTTDSMPDPLAFAKRVPASLPDHVAPDILSVTNADATASAEALRTVICNASTDDNGTGTTTTASVGADKSAAEVTVTWKRVVAATTLSGEENGPAKMEVDAAQFPSIPYSHVVVGMRANGDCDKITGLRIVLQKGAHPSNTQKTKFGLAAVQIMQPDKEAAFVPSAQVLASLQHWLHAAARKNPRARPSALAASAKLVESSASLHLLLEYVRTLVECGGDSLSAREADAVTSLVNAIKAEVPVTFKRANTARAGRKAGGGASGGSVDIAFDESASGTSGSSLSSVVTFSNENRTVRTVTGSNCLIVGNKGFNSGVVAWDFHLDEDNENDECTCFGAAAKPTSSFSYDAPNVFMVRCYNGELYGEGKSSENFPEIRAKSRIRIVYNADAGTLTYFVNDKELGVGFSGLAGKELFPAVAFYNSNRQASLTGCEILVPGSGNSAVKQAADTSTEIIAMDTISTAFSADVHVKPFTWSARKEETVNAVGNVLSAISELAAMWTPTLYIDSQQGKAGCLQVATTQAEVLPLMEPFAVHAHVSSFTTATALLQQFAAQSKTTPQFVHLAALLLRLLRASLDRLVASNVEVSDAGVIASGDHASLRTLHTILQALMDANEGYPDALQLEAVKTIETGLPILYASPDARAGLLNDLISRQLRALEEKKPLSVVHTELLARCMQFFSSSKGVISLLPSTAADAQAVQDTVALLKALLNILTAQSLTQLQSKDAKGSDSLLGSAGALLTAYQTHLFSILAATSQTGAEKLKTHKTADGSEASSQPTAQLLQGSTACADARLAGQQWISAFTSRDTAPGKVAIAYIQHVLASAKDILTVASGLLESQVNWALGGRAFSEAPGDLRRDVDGIVTSSAVGVLLPALLASLHEFSEPWLLAASSRHLSGLWAALQQYASLSQQLSSAVHARSLDLWSKKWGQVSSSSDNSDSVRLVTAAQFLSSGAKLRAVMPPVTSETWVTANQAASEYQRYAGELSLANRACEFGAWLKVTEADLEDDAVLKALDITDKAKAAGAKKYEGEGCVLVPFAWLLEQQSASVAEAHPLVAMARVFGSSYVAPVVCPINITGFGLSGKPMNLNMKLTVPSLSSADSVCGSTATLDVTLVSAADKNDSCSHFVGLFGANAQMLTLAATPLAAAANASWSKAAEMELVRRKAAGITAIDADLWRQLRAQTNGGYVAARLVSSSSAAAALKECQSLVGNPSSGESGHSKIAWHSSISHLFAATLAKLVDVFLAGPHISLEEEEIRPLLRSHMFAGGLRDEASLADCMAATGLPAELFNIPAASSTQECIQKVLADANGISGKLFDALQQFTPENALKRRAGVFPEVEIPVFVAVCKHSDRLSSLEGVISALERGEAAKIDDALVSIWKGVQVIRAFLRVQKAELKNRKPDENEASKTSNPRKLAPVQPKSFEDVLAATRDRALLVLNLNTVTSSDITVVPSDASKTAPLQSNLSAMPPSIGLQLSRLSSMGSVVSEGSDNKPTSKPALGRMVSFTAAEEPSSLTSPTTENDIASFAVEAADVTENLTAADAIAKSIREFVKAGVLASVPLLTRILTWRTLRGVFRSFAYSFAADILARNVASNASLHAIVSVLRSSLRCKFERQAGATEEPPKAEKTSEDEEDAVATSAKYDLTEALHVRHHYSANLEGCSEAILREVQLKHHAVYSSLASLLADALHAKDLRTVSVILWSWGCDVPARDHSFVLSSGIINAMSAYVLPAGAAPVSRDGATTWKPWNPSLVHLRLQAGSLSKQDVFEHIAAASKEDVAHLRGTTDGAVSGAEWLRENAIHDMRKQSTAEVAALYVAFQKGTPTDNLSIEVVDASAASKLLREDKGGHAAVLTDADIIPCGGAADSVVDKFEAIDTENRAKREPRTRKSTKNGHKHALTFSTAKNTYWCDNCGNRGDNDKIGVGMWYCTNSDCSTYYCEKCFAERKDHEEWEEMPISSASSSFKNSAWSSSDNYRLLPFPPHPGRRAFANEEFKMDFVPEFFWKGPAKNHFYTIIVHSNGAETPTSTEGFTCSVNSGRRVRVWLAIPHHPARKVTAAKCPWLFEKYTRTKHKITVSGGDAFTLFRGKTVALQSSDAGVWSSESRDEWETIKIHGLGLGSDSRNYIIILEEVAESELTYMDIHGKEQSDFAEPSKPTAAVLYPPRYSTRQLLQEQCWAVVRLLMLCSVGGAAVPHRQVKDDNLTAPPLPALLPSTSVLNRTAKASVDMLPDASRVLQSSVFDIVRGLLKTCVTVLSDTEAALETTEASTFAETALQFVYAISDMPNAKIYLADRTFVTSFLQLFRCGSPLVRTQAARILRVLISRIDPDMLEDVVQDVFTNDFVDFWADVCDTPGTTTLGMLLAIAAGPTLASAGLLQDTKVANKTDNIFADLLGPVRVADVLVGQGQAAQWAACDATYLLRSMLRITVYRERYLPSMYAVLENAPAILAASADATSARPALAALVGTLTCLGGLQDVLRVGSRVLVSNVKFGVCKPEENTSDRVSGSNAEMQATLVRYDVGIAQVVFSQDLSATPIAVEPRRLIPLAEVAAPQNLLDAYEDRFATFTSVIKAATASSLMGSYVGWLSIASLQSLLNNPAAAKLAHSSGLLGALYDVSLTASPLKNLTSVPALLGIQRTLQRVAIDIGASTATVSSTPAARDEKLANWSGESEVFKQFAKDEGVSFAVARRILQMFNLNVEHSKQWLSAYGQSYYLDVPSVKQAPTGQYSGFATIKTKEGTNANVFVLLNVEDPNLEEWNDLDDESRESELKKFDATAVLYVLKNAIDASKITTVNEASAKFVYAQVLKAESADSENVVKFSCTGSAGVEDGEVVLTMDCDFTETTWKFMPSEDAGAEAKLQLPVELLSDFLDGEEDGVVLELVPTCLDVQEGSEGETLTESFAIDDDDKSDGSGSDDDDGDDGSDGGKKSRDLLPDAALIQPSATGKAGPAGESDFPVSKGSPAQAQSGPDARQRAGRLPCEAITLQAVPQTVTEPIVVAIQGSTDPVTVDLDNIKLGVLQQADADNCYIQLCSAPNGRVSRVAAKRAAVNAVAAVHGVRLHNEDTKRSMAKKLTEITQSLQIHAARLALQTMLVQIARDDTSSASVRGDSAATSSYLTLDSAGGASKLLSLLRVVAAADCNHDIGRDSRFDVNGAQRASNSDASKFAADDVMAIAGHSYNMATLQQLKVLFKHLLLQEKQRASSQLTTVLVDDCIRNFASSLQSDASNVAVAESIHPIPGQGVYTGVLHLPGAESLELHFDSRCNTSKHETLELYSSAAMEESSLIAKFGGSVASDDDDNTPNSKGVRAWPSDKFMVSGGKVWWKLVCGAGKTLDEMIALKDTVVDEDVKSEVPEMPLRKVSAPEVADSPAFSDSESDASADEDDVSEAKSALDEEAGVVESKADDSASESAADASEEEDDDILGKRFFRDSASESGSAVLPARPTAATTRARRLVMRSGSDDDDETESTTSSSSSRSEKSLNLGGLFGDDDEEASVASSKSSKPAKVDKVAKTIKEEFGLASNMWGFRVVAKPVSGRWTSEENALDASACSLAWACWLLDFLLNQVSTVLPKGAVHNQKMFDALVAFLKNKSTEPAMREQVVTLLSQLLIHPHMFIDVPKLDGLSSLEEAVLEKLSDVDSRKAPTAKVQDLLELVIARRAAVAAFEVARKLKEGGGADETAEPYPGEGVGVLFEPKQAASGDLDLEEVLEKFKEAYSPAIAEILDPEFIMEGISAMAGGADASSGVIHYEDVLKCPDAEVKQMWQASWLALNALERGLTPEIASIPEDATMDFYDMTQLYIFARLDDGGIDATEDELTASMQFDAVQRYISCKVGIEDSELADELTWPLPYTPCKVKRPSSSKSTGPASLCSMRVVRPLTAAETFACRTLNAKALPEVRSGKCWRLHELADSADISAVVGKLSENDTLLVTSPSAVLVNSVVVACASLPAKPILLFASAHMTEGLDVLDDADAAADSQAATALAEEIAWVTSAELNAFAVSEATASALQKLLTSSSAKTESAADSSAEKTEAATAADVRGAGAAPAAFSLAGVAARLTRARDLARVRLLDRGLTDATVQASTTTQFTQLAAVSAKSGGVASFAGLPLKPVLPKTDVPKQLIDKVMMVHELAATLFENARPSDEVLCSAWVDAVGLQRHLETNHPLRANEVFKREVEIKGATKLKVIFNNRSALPSGSTLTVSYTESGKPITKVIGNKSGWAKEALELSTGKVSFNFSAPAELPEAVFGVAVTVVGTVAPSNKFSLLAKHVSEVLFASKQLLGQWTPTMDSDLVALARHLCRSKKLAAGEDSDSDSSDSDSDSSSSEEDASKKKKKYTLDSLPLEELEIQSDAEALQFSSLAEISPSQLRMRFALIKLFNKVLKETLMLFALNSTRPWTVGAKLRQLSYCVFPEVKRSVLEAALKATTMDSTSIPTLYLSNFKASESESRGDKSPDVSTCMFVQAYLHLRAVTSKALRGYEDEDQHKVFEVQFEGESGIDAGGVYREGLSRIIDDLFSERFDLLIPCPNNKRGDKVNSDAFIPNPAYQTPLALSMLEFVGRMVGMSLRTKAALSFAFPSIVWKHLVGEKPRFDDLLAMDTTFAETLQAIRMCDRESIVGGQIRPPITTEEAFRAAYPSLTFTITATDGSEQDLIPGGSTLPVTLANRVRYCDAAEAFRLHEFDAQLDAIKRGLANMVPLRALSLFTWQECEILVAGDPDVDVAVLKAKTEYSGYSKDDPVIARFWKCLESMTGEERSSYLRFVWGRSRLPGEGTSWSHTISTMSGGDATLPLAHTCFCTIDLPAYTTDARMSWGLRTAVHYGLGGILNG